MPLMPVLKRYVLGSAVIFTDDTTLALKKPNGQSNGKTTTARLWVYLAGGWLPHEQQGGQRVAPAALYDFTTDRGAMTLNDFARANDPFANVGRVQVAVEVSSVIRASPDSFRVAWTERRYQDGSLTATERWSAILTIVVQPPRTPDALRKNPLGVFVNALNWSKELSQ